MEKTVFVMDISALYTNLKTHIMKYILFIGLFSLIALVSCNKNEKIKISDDLLNCCFKTNTYWVYIDSVNNNVDSVYVVNYEHFFRETQGMSPDYIYDFECFRFETMSSPSLEWAGFEIKSEHLTKAMKSETSANTIFHNIYSDYDSYSDGDVCQCGIIFKHLDSVFVYDQYYYRVLRVELPVDTTENYEKNIYYTNSEYGIVRHEIYSDSVLLPCKILMRKNIIR